MAIFNIGEINFKAIQKEYEECLRRFNPNTIRSNKGGKENPLAFYNSKIYKIMVSSIFRAINKLEKGRNKEYCKYVLESKGDYSKRKGGDVANQMANHASFIDDFLQKSNNPALRYSLLGIFVDIWHILKDPKWVSTFKRSFSYADRTGRTNTIASSFMMIYIALVITFELIGLKMLYFEYDVYSGIEPEKSVLNIMKTHSSFMKSVVLPMIKVVCICMNIKDPLKSINDIIKDEETVKAAKKKAQESGYPYKSEENGLTVIESYKIEQMDNQIDKSKEELGPMEAIKIISTVIAGGVSVGGAAAGLTIFGITSPILVAILLFSITIIFLLGSVPVARGIVYWVNVRKVDLQKELELQAELLNNNIISLQEKLEKTSSKEERARLQNIINKQIEMLVKLQGEIKKYLDEEYEASVTSERDAKDDDTGSAKDEGDKDAGDNGDGFEVDI
jgi:hypothetical protein